MKSPIILSVLACILSLNYKAIGQDEKEDLRHPIEIEREKCHSSEENWTTYGLIQCEQIALEKWDKELNRAYKELMNQLSESQQQLLRESQRKWIQFRDLELSFQSQVYSDMQGTMWSISYASASRELTKNRATELINLLKDLTAGK